MVTWLLIVQVFAGGPQPPVQLGPFESKAACEAARAELARVVVAARQACVPTSVTD